MSLRLMLALVLASGCGARTGLEIPEFSMDAGLGRDTETRDVSDRSDVPVFLDVPDVPDVAPDVTACPPMPVVLVRTDVETVFLIDGSGSMGTTWEGLPGGGGLPTRWEIVRDTLGSVLPPFDAQLAIGGKIFPDDGECRVDVGFDVPPHLGATSELLALFDRWIPEGGTPTAEALRRVLEIPSASPRVVIATLDGGPNCNPDAGVPPDTCVCTSTRRACLRDAGACLDAAGTLDVVRMAYDELDVPVVVVGIDDPTRPDLSDFLDDMAVAGGWPLPPGGRRFYNAREPDDLRVAFAEIADIIARCVYIAPVPPPEDAAVEVRLDGVPIARDPSHMGGWDWSSRVAGALTLFGAECDAVRARDVEVTAEIVCRE